MLGQDIPIPPIPLVPCEKIRGRRRRQCVRAASVTIGFEIARVRYVVVADAHGRTSRVRETYTTPYTWRACATHANRARRNGATVAERARA